MANRHGETMGSIMIWSQPEDVHARAVEWALNRKGVPTRVWLGSDFPIQSTASISISGGRQVPGKVTLKHRADTLFSDLDVLWRRRSGAPMLSEDLHPGDKVVAINECNQLNNNLNYLLDQGAKFCVNSYEGAQRARSKALQLQVAARVGLRVPETLITNDHAELSRFYADHHGSLIIKSFTCPTWSDDRKAFFAYSTRVTPHLLEQPESVQASPAIYQELIPKRYEVRAFFAGRHHLAVRLDSQTESRSKLDWRAMSTARIPVEEITLPEAVSGKCIALMQELGIVTGSFDFAVTETEEYVFFEVNEQGQFLWMEARCPKLPCLQMFCDFLLSGDPSFIWSKSPAGEDSLHAYRESGQWQRSLELERTEHARYLKRQPFDEGTQGSDSVDPSDATNVR
jgi:glutathione synthase/RimK-type ligase-like ATP-grasp enzyme